MSESSKICDQELVHALDNCTEGHDCWLVPSKPRSKLHVVPDSTQSNAMRLVTPPKLDVENLVPTIYHLFHECNLTIYDIECELLT